MKKWHILIIAICIILGVVTFRGMATANEGASYYLLYASKGTQFNSYVVSKAGVKQYQYAQGMQKYGDLLGDDRTGDLHDIKEPSHSAGNAVIDTDNLELSKSAQEQFVDIQKALREAIDTGYTGSDQVKGALLEEVNGKIEGLSKGDISYQIPLDCFLELSDVVNDKKDTEIVQSAKIETFIYKKKENVTIVNGEANLSEKNLTASLIWDKDLRKIAMNDSWLNQAVLADNNLSGGNLSGSTLLGTVIVNCDLADCNLSKANLSGTVFIGSNLNGANLVGAIMEDVEFKSLGNKKVKIDIKWKEMILDENIKGLENIDWVSNN